MKNDPFAGKWNVDDGRTWEFFTIKKILYSSGTIVYEGRWRQLEGSRIRDKAEYWYTPGDDKLFIDHRAVDAPGVVRPRAVDSYRVTFVDRETVNISPINDDGPPHDPLRMTKAVR